MKVVHKGQLETGKVMRMIAMICVLLALLMTGVEATHAHADPSFAGNSSPCVICLTAHAKAPSVTIQFLPLIYAVETVAVMYESQGKSAAPQLSLFIRPPPSA